MKMEVLKVILFSVQAILFSALLAMIITIVAAIVVATPYGPTAISRENDSRADFSSESAKQIQAQAGNITQLTINTSIITYRWQGYYGNISGTITLENANGYAMYDWLSGPSFSPVGEIYAANESITSWSDIICVNLTGNGTLGQHGINVTIIEDYFGMDPTDTDGGDETFTARDSIIVGSITLPDCPATHIYNSSGAQSDYWNETLLTENATGVIVFAADVHQDSIGFDGNPWDFQMIVGEDGDTAETTTYYFYVELV